MADFSHKTKKKLKKATDGASEPKWAHTNEGR